MLGKRRQQVKQPFFLFCLFHHFLSVLPIFATYATESGKHGVVLVVKAPSLCAGRPCRHITGSCVHPGLEETLGLGPCLGLSIDILRHATLNRRKTWSREILSCRGGGVVLNLF